MADLLGRLYSANWLGELRVFSTKLSPRFVDNFFLVCTVAGFAVIGMLVGMMAWGQGPEIWRLGWLLLLPVAWSYLSSRWAAGGLMFAYYLAGARGLPGGVGIFFGEASSWWMGLAFTVGVCTLLTLPFLLLWSAKVGGRGWRFVVAVSVSLVPPLAIIGWINPIMVAGALYPGFGWLGLGLGGGLMYALAGRQWSWAVVMLAAAIAANGWTVGHEVKAPDGWQGVDTHFSRLNGGQPGNAGELLAAMERVHWIKEFADTVPANSVRMLPETILGPFGASAEWSLREVEAGLASRGSRVLAGAEIYRDDGRYLNAVVVLGANPGEQRMAVQGIPVPVSMWKPWAADGALGAVFSDGGVIGVLDRRVGVLVCYEQLLAFSGLWVMAKSPDVLVGAANAWWVRDATIPVIQGQMMDSFGRLFGVGVVRGVNW